MKLSFVLWGAGFLPTTHIASAFQIRHHLSPVVRAVSSCAPPLASLVNIDESTGRDIGALDEWANACGVQRVEGFELDNEDGGLDWSVVTNEPLAEGSPVLSVPNEMILSSTRVREELGSAVEDAVGQLRRLGANDQVPQFYLFIKILTMYEMGEQSPWFPWLNSLPRLYYNAVSMTSKSDESWHAVALRSFQALTSFYRVFF